jgi:hypothetical protein
VYRFRLIFSYSSRFRLAGISQLAWTEIRGAGQSELAPVAEMIWAPLLGSFWASVEIVKKYMGVRERDKAHEYELRNGAPLNSTNATIEAAGGTIANLIRALRSG